MALLLQGLAQPMKNEKKECTYLTSGDLYHITGEKRKRKYPTPPPGAPRKPRISKNLLSKLLNQENNIKSSIKR